MLPSYVAVRLIEPACLQVSFPASMEAFVAGLTDHWAIEVASEVAVLDVAERDAVMVCPTGVCVPGRLRVSFGGSAAQLTGAVAVIPSSVSDTRSVPTFEHVITPCGVTEAALPPVVHVAEPATLMELPLA